MTARPVNSKSEFYADYKYTRMVMRQLDRHLKNNDWEQVRQCSQELSGIFAGHEWWAEENANGESDDDRCARWAAEEDAKQVAWQEANR